MASVTFRPLIRLGRRVRALVRDRGSLRRPGFRTTGEGKLFIVGTFAIGFGAYNTATNLLYLIFSIMLAMLVVSAILSRLTLKGLDVERLMPSSLVAGQGATVHLKVTNRKRWLPSLSLRMVDVLSTRRALGEAYAVLIRGRSTATLGYRAAFERRGLWRLERLVVATRFPFGFVEKSLGIPLPREVIVYPPMIDLTGEVTEAQLGLGEFESSRRGPGASLHGLREYTPQDPARHIHWRVSAKAGEIVLREFEQEEKKRVTVVLDSLGGESESDDFERAVIYAASLCKYLIDRDHQVQLLTAQGRVPFGLGLPHLTRLLRSLAIVELREQGEAVPGLHTAHAVDSVVVGLRFSDRPLPSICDQLIDTRGWEPHGLAAQVASGVEETRREDAA